MFLNTDLLKESKSSSTIVDLNLGKFLLEDGVVSEPIMGGTLSNGVEQNGFLRLVRDFLPERTVGLKMLSQLNLTDGVLNLGFSFVEVEFP